MTYPGSDWFTASQGAHTALVFTAEHHPRESSHCVLLTAGKTHTLQDILDVPGPPAQPF
jgi:hypothetical protein